MKLNFIFYSDCNKITHNGRKLDRLLNQSTLQTWCLLCSIYKRMYLNNCNIYSHLYMYNYVYMKKSYRNLSKLIYDLTERNVYEFKSFNEVTLLYKPIKCSPYIKYC